MSTYKPNQMAAAINTIGRAVLEEKIIPTVTSNGNVVITPTNGYDGMSKVTVPVEVSGGGGKVTENDVNFYDYDGTIVASYSAADFANLTALPANPNHTADGLTAQGWNWSLSDAKTYVAAYGMLDIGQMYTTTDGKTRVYIHLETGRLSPTLGLGVNGSVDIDWGDGTAHSTLTGTSLYTKVETIHTYSAAGDYVVALTVTGNANIFGTGNYSYLFYASNYARYAYLNAVQRVEIGANMGIGSYAFFGCVSLASVTIPNTVTSIGSGAFYGCYSLPSMSIPSTVTSIGNNTFYNCYSLTSVSIPSTVTSIGGGTFSNCCSLPSVNIQSSVISIGSSTFLSCSSLTFVSIPSTVTSIEASAFSNCYSLPSVNIPSTVTNIGISAFSGCRSLTSVSIPSTVTSIGSATFNNCVSLGFIKFAPSTPPTVSSSDTFSSISTDCKILVPTGTLTAYTTATNYPDPSTYTYVEY